jgi:hypothetical protein
MAAVKLTVSEIWNQIEPDEMVFERAAINASPLIAAVTR